MDARQQAWVVHGLWLDLYDVAALHQDPILIAAVAAAELYQAGVLTTDGTALVKARPLPPDILGFQRRPPAAVADPEGVAGQLHHPKQARGLDAAVVVVDLGARTGLEQVNSYKGEQAALAGAVLGGVGARYRPHVGSRLYCLPSLPVAVPA